MTVINIKKLSVNFYLYRISLCFWFLCGKICFSQTLLSNVKYQVESGAFLSTSGKTPFLLRANQYGVVPIESEYLTFRGVAYKDYDSVLIKKQNKIAYGYGLNTVINVGKANQILFPEAYIKIRYGAFEFYSGRRKEIYGIVDTLLTSGSYIWSGNALPLPKIQVSIPNYTSIIGHGILSIKGGYAHGWFGRQGDVKNYYLHQKWLYGRIGKPTWKIKFYGGFNHQVQWGGHPIKPYIEDQTGRLITNFGNDFKTYLNVVTGVSLNTKGGLALDGVPQNEAWNRSGNHLGTVDIATEVNLKNTNLLIYRQNIYEDGSLFYLNNISDGLFGFSLVRKNVEKGIIRVCFEYLNTTSQGGTPEERHDEIFQLRGADNYFNNGIYSGGWTYRNNIIGTPLMTQLSEIKGTIINKYNLSELPNIVNNRLRAYNFSLTGKMLKTSFTTKFIWSNNLGVYTNPFLAKQFSFIQQLSYERPKYVIVSSLSIDSGKLIANNLGFYFGIRKTFF